MSPHLYYDEADVLVSYGMYYMYHVFSVLIKSDLHLSISVLGLTISNILGIRSDIAIDLEAIWYIYITYIGFSVALGGNCRLLQSKSDQQKQ